MADEQKQVVQQRGTLDQVAERVGEAHNILVTLSKNPGVDDLSAAIGLALMLDKMGKHVTAIFSGRIPDALSFLEPKKIFEDNTASLQDFIIALDKSKADHLRYKIEGDFVKVFITPYRYNITEKDLQFERGDFNVDLVIGMNVKEVKDLDAALTEYGRISHAATSIDITTDMPGKFGDLEWVDPSASSVAELIYDLANTLEVQLDKAIATALLTGVVAATDRFSNEKTTPKTMVISSELMKMGADQKLIASSMVASAEKELEEMQKKDGKLKVDERRERPAAEKKNAERDLTEPERPKDPTRLQVRDDKKVSAAGLAGGLTAPEKPAGGDAGTGAGAGVDAGVGAGAGVGVKNGDASRAEAEKKLEEMTAPKVNPLMEELKRKGQTYVDEQPEVAPVNDGKDYEKIMAEELAQPLPGEDAADTMPLPPVPITPSANVPDGGMKVVVPLSDNIVPEAKQPDPAVNAALLGSLDDSQPMRAIGSAELPPVAPFSEVVDAATALNVPPADNVPIPPAPMPATTIPEMPVNVPTPQAASPAGAPMEGAVPDMVTAPEELLPPPPPPAPPGMDGDFDPASFQLPPK